MRALKHAAVVLLCLGAVPALAYDIEFSKLGNTYFGDAYYNYQGGDKFRSMAILMAAERQGRLGDERQLAALFLAQNLAGLGLNREAIDAYDRLVKSSDSQAIRASAALESAKLKLALAQYAAALESLALVKRTLGAEQEADFKTARAAALLAQGGVDEAIAALPKISTDSLWALYQQFNIGVSLIEKHKNKNGALILHQIGRLEESGNSEVQAIKDQANLALGFSLLKINKPQNARAYLEKVRLESHLSAAALLGMGWSYSSEKNYEQALVFWLELQKRANSSAYAYETLLAVPYGLGMAGGYKQAIDYYQTAQQRIERDVSDLEEAKKKIGSEVFTRLISAMPDDESAWLGAWQESPESPENRFLTLLLDNAGFQATLMEYRALLRLERQIDVLATQVEQLDSGLNPAQGAADISQLKARQRQLSQQTEMALSENLARLQQQALETFSRYQMQLQNYAEQIRFGIAQAIEGGTFKTEEGL